MSGLWHRFKQEMRNPRKAALFVGLLAVALVLWGRMLVDHVPRPASAQQSATTTADDAASQPWSEPLLPPEPHRPRVAVALADRLPRDLFALPRDGFELTRDAQLRQSREKLSVEVTDERSRLTEVRAAGAALSLESIVTGNPPRAMISGRVLTPGQQVDGFTLVRVAERFVLLEKDGVTVRLDL